MLSFEKSNKSEGRAADNVVDLLERRIRSGELENGQPLPAERDLMEDFGASRTVIREAILALSSRGLIENKPRFRPIVRKPNYETVLNATGKIVQSLLNEAGDIQNLYDSRVFIERALVRDAATSANKEDIADLKAALAANEAAISDSTAFYETDVAFHGALYRVPKNPIFPAIHTGYTAWLAPHWDKMLRSPERNEMNFCAHQTILAAIMDRDPATAEDALVLHLDAAWDHVRTTF